MEEIYNKYISDLMKRAFVLDGEGSCVRLSVAQDVLKEALQECYDVKPSLVYDFWGQEVK